MHTPSRKHIPHQLKINLNSSSDKFWDDDTAFLSDSHKIRLIVGVFPITIGHIWI